MKASSGDIFLGNTKHLYCISWDGARKVKVKAYPFLWLCGQVQFHSDCHSFYRYLLCEINISVTSNRLLLEDKAIFLAVKDAVASMHGDYGAAHCSIGFSGNSNSEAAYVLLLINYGPQVGTSFA